MISPRTTENVANLPSGAGESPTGDWPVLARLPLVPADQSAFAPLPEVPPTFDQVAEPSTRLELESDDGPAVPPRHSSARHTFYDRPHLASRASAEQSAAAAPAAPSTQSWIDASPHRSYQLDARRRVDRRPPQRDYGYAAPTPDHRTSSGAGELFERLHAAIDRNAALIVTVALILSAGLMYWIAFGQPSSSQGLTPAQLPSTWSVETTGSSAMAPRRPDHAENNATDSTAADSQSSDRRDETDDNESALLDPLRIASRPERTGSAGPRPPLSAGTVPSPSNDATMPTAPTEEPSPRDSAAAAPPRSAAPATSEGPQLAPAAPADEQPAPPSPSVDSDADAPAPIAAPPAYQSTGAAPFDFTLLLTAPTGP